MDTPVNTSSGSHHLRSGLILLACTHPISSVTRRLRPAVWHVSMSRLAVVDL